MWRNGEYKLCLSILLDEYIKQLSYIKWSPLYLKMERLFPQIRQMEEFELGDK